MAKHSTGIWRRLSVTGMVLAGGMAAACAATAAEQSALPQTMVWTSYDIGGAGYAEAQAVANAFMKEYGSRVRVLPSGTSIGRLLPMTTGKAQYGYLANEVFFATEAMYDFAVPEWGPQDLRIVLGRPATIGMATAADAGIEKMTDFKGKSVGYVKGNPSVNIKTDAMLAFAGLTRDDINVVWFGGYAAMTPALIARQIDSYASVTISGRMIEIDASPRGLTWPPMPADDKEGWQRALNVASFLEPKVDPEGVALSEENPGHLAGYRFPMITTLAGRSAEEVYEYVRAMNETYDSYKDATAAAARWKIEQSGKTPADAPWHQGSIRYLEEKGIWTADDQAWNDQRLARLESVISAWDGAMADFQKMRAEEAEKGSKIDTAKAWPEYWAEYRKEHLN